MVQINSPGETFPTTLAHIRFAHGSIVGAHMVRHSVLAFEPEPAHRTRVRLLPGVSPRVDLQATILCEAFSTLQTGVWLLPGVNAHVDAQRGFVDK